MKLNLSINNTKGRNVNGPRTFHSSSSSSIISLLFLALEEEALGFLVVGLSEVARWRGSCWQSGKSKKEHLPCAFWCRKNRHLPLQRCHLPSRHPRPGGSTSVKNRITKNVEHAFCFLVALFFGAAGSESFLVEAGFLAGAFFFALGFSSSSSLASAGTSS